LNDGAIVLLLVAAAGLIGGNQLVAVAAAVLLLICATAPAPLLSWIGQYSVQAGILLMTLGLLSPFAAGKIGLGQVVSTLLAPSGFVAVLIGAVASYLGFGGLNLMMVRPEVMVGLVVGSILGVSLLGGIPTGPLVAAGLTALLYRLLKVS